MTHKSDKQKECLCDTPYCAKCLGGNCQDDNCQIHTKEAKERYRRNNPERFQSDKPPANATPSQSLFQLELPIDIAETLNGKVLYITIWRDSSLMIFTEENWQEQRKHLERLMEEEPAEERAYAKLILNSAQPLVLNENAVAIPDYMLHHVGKTDNLSITTALPGIRIKPYDTH